MQLLKLMEDAAAGRIGRVFVYKFDRLGRAAETHSMVADLEESGVEVISATEGKEALSRGIQLVVAEHYSKAPAERTFAGLVKRFESRE
jgi:DNA invertase Pin-like site-specific DNA recombinase